MSTSLQSTQICALYQQGLSADMIAAELGLCADYVSQVLMHNGLYMRSAIIKSKSECEYVNDSELQSLYSELMQMAHDPEDKGMQFKAITHLIDEARGRRDIEKQRLEHDKARDNQQQSMNLALLQGLLQKARQQKEILLGGGEIKMLEENVA